MDEVVAAGAAADPVVFATNSMAIAVPPANPGKVTGLDDLTDPAVKTALCQPAVPCGSTARTVLTNAGLTVTPVTLEPDVKAVLSKVRLGEVDAGVVYVTDVIAAGDEVTGIEIPDDVNASTDYPIAALTQQPPPCRRRGVRRLRAVVGRDVRAVRRGLRGSPDVPTTLSPTRTRSPDATSGGASRSAPAPLLVPALVGIAVPRRPAGRPGRPGALG